MSVATQTLSEKVGTGGVGRKPLREAGHGELEGGERERIPGGWEWIWVEDPWTGRSERVRVPREEADYGRRQRFPPRLSYWGEKEAMEWRRRLREEKERVEQEERERKAWRLEEALRRRCSPVPGTPTMREVTPSTWKEEKKRPYL